MQYNNKKTESNIKHNEIKHFWRLKSNNYEIERFWSFEKKNNICYEENHVAVTNFSEEKNVSDFNFI